MLTMGAVDAFSYSMNHPAMTAFSNPYHKQQKQCQQCHNKFQLYSSSSSSDEFEDKMNKRRRNRNNRSNDNESENDSEIAKPLLPLPPIGESSYGSIPSAHDESQSTIDETTGQKKIILNSEEGTKVAQVGSSKFELQYTCNICETRNTHKVSRLGAFENNFICLIVIPFQYNLTLNLIGTHYDVVLQHKAYTKGVVITVCKGCMTKHLIADNLGWSKYWGLGGGFEGKTNIEEYMDEIGKGDEVNRVSKDVFHLEQIYGDNGSIDSGEQISEEEGNAFE